MVDRVSTPGNHDLSEGSLDSFERSTLNVLEAAGKVAVIKSSQSAELFSSSGDDGIIVCGVPYGQEPEKGFTSAPGYGIKVLILHIMTWPGTKDPYPGASKEGMSAPGLLKKYPDFDIILTGHNHQTFGDNGRRQRTVVDTIIEPILDQSFGIMRNRFDQLLFP